jgi:flagellar biosynthesis protein FliR
VFAAVQSAGGLIDLFAGFSLAQAFDPGAFVNGAQFTRLLHLVALALLFTSGGYELILGGLVRTFDALPITGALDPADPAGQLIGGVSQMFLASVQIAGPIILVLFLADVGLALLTRVAPQMNAFAMGYPLKILVTLLVAGVVFLALPRVVTALVEDGLQAMGVVGR